MKSVRSVRSRRPPRAEPAGVSDLENLAAIRFGPLWPTESQLIGAVQRGEALDVPGPNLVACARVASSGAVRGALLRWLCTAKDASERIDAKGLRLLGAQIVGLADLESVDCKFPLVLERCSIPDGLNLDNARFPHLRLQDSQLTALTGTRLRLGASLILTGATVRGEIRLLGATIEGNVGLARATLLNRQGCALNLESASVGGNIYMGPGFRSDGHVRIYGAHIRKNIECSGHILAPRQAVSLMIESTNVGGSVLLRRGFRALGQVRVYASTIDGAVDCQGARMAARHAPALVVEGSRVRGSLLLSNNHLAPAGSEPFCCLGGVRVGRSTVDGNLDFNSAQLRSRQRPAAELVDVKVDGRLLAPNLQVQGGLVLDFVAVKNDLVFRGASLNNPVGGALRARGLRCGGRLSFERPFHAWGTVDLWGADIGDEFDARGARFTRSAGNAVVMNNCKIRSSAFWTECVVVGDLRWPDASVGVHVDFVRATLNGELRMSGVQIGGHLSMSGAVCRNAAGNAVHADRLRCAGSVVLRDQFQCDGMSLYGATIGGDLYASGASFSRPGDTALQLENTRVGGHVILIQASIAGQVGLARAVVGGSVDLSRTQIVRPGTLALDAGGCSVGGDLRLCEGFATRGGIGLDRSRVGGNLNLTTCLVRWPRRVAVSMVGAHVHGDLDLGDAFNLHSLHGEARCCGTFDARKASVDGNMDLSSAWLLNRSGDSLRCERMTVKGSLEMGDDFRANGVIDLRNASVGLLVDDEASWARARGLELEGLTYTAIRPADAEARLRWLGRGGGAAAPRDTSWQAYEQLAQVLKRQGRERDARKIAIAKQDHVGKHGLGSLPARVAHGVYGETMRYGYRPQRALLFAPLFIIGLMLAFWSGADQLMEPSNDAAQKVWVKARQLPAGYPAFNATAYAVDAFVPILNLQQKDSWRPNDRAQCDPGPEHCGFWLRVYLWLHVAFGWTITTLAVAGFTGLVRRD